MSWKWGPSNNIAFCDINANKIIVCNVYCATSYINDCCYTLHRSKIDQYCCPISSSLHHWCRTDEITCHTRHSRSCSHTPAVYTCKTPPVPPSSGFSFWWTSSYKENASSVPQVDKISNEVSCKHTSMSLVLFDPRWLLSCTEEMILVLCLGSSTTYFSSDLCAFSTLNVTSHDAKWHSYSNNSNAAA